MAKSEISSLEDVHKLLEDLIKMHVIHRVDQSAGQDNNLEKTLPGSRVFQYITDILPPSRGDTLNTGACWFGKSRSAVQVSCTLTCCEFLQGMHSTVIDILISSILLQNYVYSTVCRSMATCSLQQKGSVHVIGPLTATYGSYKAEVQICCHPTEGVPLAC